MPKLFGYHTKLEVSPARFGLPKPYYGVASNEPVPELPPEPKAPPQEPRHWFAISVPPRGGQMKVFEYEDNEAGRGELANLIAGERVLYVIFGHSVDIEKYDSVQLTLGDEVTTHRLPLPKP